VRLPISLSLQLFALTGLLAGGLGAQQRAAPGAASTTAGRGEVPLAPFAAMKVAVMPVQFLRTDTAGPVKAADWAILRRELDDSIGVAIAERGIGRKWAYAADVARMAKRNAGYVSDPYTLGAGGLRMRTLKAEEQAPRTMIDNMRSLIALGDARYALVPVELAFAKQGNEWRGVLRLLMVDGRVGQLTWFADLPVETGASFGSAAIGVLAQRIADLVVAR
jgi:hypothetical protein